MRGWKKMWGMSVSAAQLKNKKIWDWIMQIQKNNEFENMSFTKKYWTFAPSKKIFFFWCMYKMDPFPLFTAKAWRKTGVDAIEYGGEIWINQGHLEEKLDLSNISDRTQYYSDKLTKIRCEIQERGNYQPYRVLVQILAVQLIMTAKKRKQLFLRQILELINMT